MTETTYRVIGKPAPRIEAPAKVTGQMIYAADLQFPGMLHAKILRSPHAHARITGIETSAAEALPGVRAVVTAADLPPGKIDPSVRAHIVFARDEVIFNGQPVAAVAADSPEIAEEAIGLIQVEYQELPAVLDVELALRDDSPLARLATSEAEGEDREGHMTVSLDTKQEAGDRRTNATNRLNFRQGDVERGFAEADVVVEGRFEAAMVHQTPIEPQVCVAHYESGRLTVWSPTQGQFHQREEIATILDLPISRVRVISVEIGGGFGGSKVGPLVHPVAGLLSMKTGWPVKLVLTRKEDLMAGVPAQRTITIAKIGAKRDGTLTTFQTNIIFDAGAFSNAIGLASVLLAACYRFEHFDIQSVKVLTNKVSTGAYRAPGLPEIAFGIEQLIDEIATKLGRDPIDFRRQNVVREGDPMPNGKRWPKIGSIECLDALEQSALWRNRRNGTRGIGVAIGGWLGGFQPSSALVRLNEHGTFSVLVGSNDISGTNTTFAQIAAEALNVPLARVDASVPDTDSAPYGGMVVGSKSIYSYGPAVASAAEDAKQQIFEIAAAELGTSPDGLVFDDCRVTDPATGKQISLERIGGLSMSNGARYAPILGRGRGGPRDNGPGFTAQAVEVEVDPATGQVTVTGVAAVQDVGRALNPLSVEGQLEGGVIQSLGMGLTEELLFDERGRLRNPTLLDYRLLTALDVPTIESILVEVPSPEGPFGARIVGEPPIIAGSAALANAIHAATGVRLHEAPMTPGRIAGRLKAGFKG